MFTYKKIFFDLIKEDIHLLSQTLFDKTINGLIWVVSTVAISAYILPALGVSASYGAFMAVGTIVGCGGFEIVTQMVNMLADFDGDKKITYHLTLPIPNWLLLVKMGLVFAFNSLFISTVSFFTCKLVLWHSFNISIINYPRFILAGLLISLFFGFFTLFLVSITKSLMHLDNVFMRMAFPLWMLGGFQFSWMVLSSYSHSFALLNLLNPYTYATEALRAAALGQEGYLPFWLSILGLCFFIGLFAVLGIGRLKKRLDFV